MQRRAPQVGPRRRTKLLVLGVFTFGIIAAIVAFWLRVSGTESVVINDDVEYVEGVAGTWQRVNPLFASANEVDQDIAALVFSGLIRVGANGEPTPDLLAQLPTVSGDGQTYTFTLRPGLKWHDGEPLTASDVRFTIERLQDADFRGDPLLAAGWEGVSITVETETTFVLRLQAASAPFLVRSATIGILPEHSLQGKTSGALFDDPFNAAPVGSGPYRLESLNSQEAVLRANGDYHDGRPEIDVVRLRFFADYPAALRAMQAQRLDGLYLRNFTNAAVASEIESLEDVDIDRVTSSATTMLYLNNSQFALFGDARVRQAISLAIDRERLTREIFGDFAQPSASQVAPSSWAYTADYDTQREANVEEAKSLLAAAGWVLPPATGVLTKEGGEFRFTIRTDSDQTRIAVANAIALDLEPLGIRATVVSTTFSVLRRDFLQERKYDAAVANWDQGADPDPYAAWHSSQMGTAGLNLANFADAIVDELIGKARTVSDQTVRQDLYRQFQEKWEELAPSIVLLYPEGVYIRTNAIEAPETGTLFSPDMRFDTISQWKR